jgi:hypothetical protein
MAHILGVRSVAARAHPTLAKAMRGNAVDGLLKQMVKADPISKWLGLRVTERFAKGPDFFLNKNHNIWWDLTTKKAWPKHINKYGKGAFV